MNHQLLGTWKTRGWSTNAQTNFYYIKKIYHPKQNIYIPNIYIWSFLSFFFLFFTKPKPPEICWLVSLDKAWLAPLLLMDSVELVVLGWDPLSPLRFTGGVERMLLKSPISKFVFFFFFFFFALSFCCFVFSLFCFLVLVLVFWLWLFCFLFL